MTYKRLFWAAPARNRGRSSMCCGLFDQAGMPANNLILIVRRLRRTTADAGDMPDSLERRS